MRSKFKDDTLLLAYIFEKGSDTIPKTSNLVPADFLSEPVLVWIVYLKVIKIQPELLTDIDVTLMI